MPKYDSLYQRLIANTAEPENAQACWVWTAQRDRWGYGRLNIYVAGLGKTVKAMAHITLWELLMGPVPPGKQLDHLCHNEACINPDHLEPVTPSENCRRRDARKFVKIVDHCFIN
jgi:hypothetical protein